MTIHTAAEALHLDPHLADYERATFTMDRISALHTAVAWLVWGETSMAKAALDRLDDDVVALAATVGTFLAVGAEQVLADRANAYHLTEDQGGFPVGAGSRRAI